MNPNGSELERARRMLSDAARRAAGGHDDLDEDELVAAARTVWRFHDAGGDPLPELTAAVARAESVLSSDERASHFHWNQARFRKLGSSDCDGGRPSVVLVLKQALATGRQLGQYDRAERLYLAARRDSPGPCDCEARVSSGFPGAPTSPALEPVAPHDDGDFVCALCATNWTRWENYDDVAGYLEVWEPRRS